MTDVNLNQAQCIQTQTGIGSSTFYNICSGTKTTVPWGAGDWFVVLAFLAVAYGVYRAAKYMQNN